MTNIFLRIIKYYLTPHIWNIRILPFKAVIFKRAYGIVAPRPTPVPMEMHINFLSTSMWGIKTLQLSLNFLGRLVTVAKIPAQTSSLSLSFQRKFSDYCKNPRLNSPITPGFQGRKQTVHPTQNQQQSLFSSSEGFGTFACYIPHAGQIMTWLLSLMVIRLWWVSVAWALRRIHVWARESNPWSGCSNPFLLSSYCLKDVQNQEISWAGLGLEGGSGNHKQTFPAHWAAPIHLYNSTVSVCEGAGMGVHTLMHVTHAVSSALHQQLWISACLTKILLSNT